MINALKREMGDSHFAD